MKFVTYILLSLVASKTYVGYTNDLANRLSEHNSGEANFTKRFKPWKLIHKEFFDTKDEAVKREKYFKSAAGRKWMKKNLFS